MKTVCKTNIKAALRKSWDTGMYEDVTDEWAVRISRNGSYLGVAPMCDFHVRLWNYDTGEELWTNVGGCTSMTEYVEYATQCLMQMWDDRNHEAKYYAVVDVTDRRTDEPRGLNRYVTFVGRDDDSDALVRHRAKMTLARDIGESPDRCLVIEYGSAA
jgi:hypothetical protein